MKYRLWLLILNMGVVLAGETLAVVYVDCNATGGNDGSSWADAYTSLTNALYLTTTGDLWVAKGAYTSGPNAADTFQLKNRMNLYGGFTNGMAALTNRDWNAHQTILDGQRTNYHVLKTGQTNIIDGFIITNGNACGSGNDGYGAGLLLNGRIITVSNCTFTGNSANQGGAGISLLTYEGATVSACAFIGNTATNLSGWNGGGGGIHIYSVSATISNCTFVGNSAGYCGGAIRHRGSGSVVINGCAFKRNSCPNSGEGGGAISAREVTGSTTVKDSTFVANTSFSGGGINCNTCSTSLIENCTFSTNYCSDSGGGITFNQVVTGTVTQCRFSGNTVVENAAGLAISGSGAVVSDCLFAGQSCKYGALSWGTSTGTVIRCAFVGNYGSIRGGGIYIYQIDVTTSFVENCTFVANYGATGGGIRNLGSEKLAVANCIFWGNLPEQIYNDTAGPIISYTDLQGGLSAITPTNMIDGGGNITNNPLFADAVNGNWTAAGTYDPEAGQSTLTNSGAGWTPGQLVGMTVLPDTNNATAATRYLQFIVASNQNTTITVWGNAAVLATNGAAYRIQDIHVSSLYGRWTPLGWTNDVTYSPTIDAGDPLSAYELEPRPNGGRINMGRHGNTVEASKSYLAGGSIMRMY